MPQYETGSETDQNCFWPASYLDIYDNCIPVYINVNVHLFVNDDCCGKTKVFKESQINSFGLAENIVQQANEAFANNQQQWHLDAPAACIPIRYVLKGTYMHCKTEIDFWTTPTSPFLINNQSEINIFFQPTGDNSGVAWGFPNYRALSMSNKEIGTFNHEMGHNFGLLHAFISPDLAAAPCTDDTDPHLVNWDANGNGTYADWLTYFPGNTNPSWVREKDYFCWAEIENWPLNIGHEADKNNNNIHDCDEGNGVGNAAAPSPCCGWGNINNNVMGYNRYLNALTQCQSLFMLSNIDSRTVLCDYRNTSGGGCPPASAFITQVPLEKNNAYCTETLILSSSFGESEYRLRIFNNANQGLVYSSGWINGTAQDVRFTSSQTASCNGCIYLNPSTTFKAVLTVENDCDEPYSYEYIFTTYDCHDALSVQCPYGEIDPEEGGTESLVMNISPNPTTGTINVSFDAVQGEIFQMTAKNLQTASLSVINAGYTAYDGQNNISINVTSLPVGPYQIMISNGQKIYQGNFIKL